MLGKHVQKIHCFIIFPIKTIHILMLHSSQLPPPTPPTPQPPNPPGHLWPPTGFTKGDIIAHRRLSKDPQLETLRGLPAGLVWLLVVHGRNLQLEQTCWKIEAGRNGEKCGLIEPKCGKKLENGEYHPKLAKLWKIWWIYSHLQPKSLGFR